MSKICGHCGLEALGYASDDGNTPLCHPLGVFEDPERPYPRDCYHLVTVYGHTAPCRRPECQTGSPSHRPITTIRTSL